MKLQEIIEAVDALIPNTITNSTKIGWINHVQNQFYRDYPMPEKTAVFDVEVGQQFFSLPSDCPEDRISDVTIDNIPYTYMPRGLDMDYEPTYFFTVVTGQLMIHPAPKNEGIGVLYYKASPVQLTTNDMASAPTFPADFHEMLILGCASRVAKAMKNTDLAAVFDGDFYRLAEKADLVLRRFKPKKVAVVRSWM